MTKRKEQKPKAKIVVSSRYKLPKASIEVDSDGEQVIISIPSNYCIIGLIDLAEAVGGNLSKVEKVLMRTSKPFRFEVIFRDGRAISLEVDIEAGTVESFCFSEGPPWENPISTAKISIPQACKKTA